MTYFRSDIDVVLGVRVVAVETDDWVVEDEAAKQSLMGQSTQLEAPPFPKISAPTVISDKSELRLHF